MTDVTPTPTETVAAPAQVAEAAAEVKQEEAFDKDRAMATIHSLREIEKKAKQDLKELEQLRQEKQQRAEAEMTEAQKHQKAAEEAKAENAKLKADILRRDVIAETGLPAVLADRLQGATKEEMLEDAKKLQAAFPVKPNNPHLQPTNPNGANATETDAQKRERLFGRQGNPFDLETIKAQGGGVVWKK